MGYETQVYIEINPAMKGANIRSADIALNDLLEENFCVEHEDVGCFDVRDAHWGDFTEEIAKLSKKHPEVMFDVFGNGDECDDVWSTYCYRGHMQDGYTLTQVQFNKEYCLHDVRSGLLVALNALLEDGYQNDDPLVQEILNAINKEMEV